MSNSGINIHSEDSSSESGGECDSDGWSSTECSDEDAGVSRLRDYLRELGTNASGLLPAPSPFRQHAKSPPIREANELPARLLPRLRCMPLLDAPMASAQQYPALWPRVVSGLDGQRHHQDFATQGNLRSVGSIHNSSSSSDEDGGRGQCRLEQMLGAGAMELAIKSLAGVQRHKGRGKPYSTRQLLLT